jgi:hypothetical protein
LKLRSTILDGEIVGLDSAGIPRFQLLQQWQKRPAAPVVYFLFDLFWSDGRDITSKTAGNDGSDCRISSKPKTASRSADTSRTVEKLTVTVVNPCFTSRIPDVVP